MPITSHQKLQKKKQEGILFAFPSFSLGLYSSPSFLMTNQFWLLKGISIFC